MKHGPLKLRMRRSNIAGGRSETVHIEVLVGMTLLTFLLLSFMGGKQFFSVVNFQSIGFQLAEVGILAMGMALAILLAGIDLSIVAIGNLAAILVAFSIKNISSEEFGALQWVFALGLGMSVGLVCGAINGMIIGFLRVPALLATLTMMTLYGGISVGITGGSSLSRMPAPFAWLGNGLLWKLPVPFLLLCLVALIIWFCLEKTIFGFHVYLLGTNAAAARHTGFDTRLIYLRTHMIIGALASLGGIIILSRTNSASYSYGSSYLLHTILLVAMGGVSVFGGYGRIVGVLLAALLLQLASTGMNMLLYRVSGGNFFRDFVWGALLIIVMTLMYFFESKKSKD